MNLLDLPDELLGRCLLQALPPCPRSFWALQKFARHQTVCRKFRRVVKYECASVWEHADLRRRGNERSFAEFLSTLSEGVIKSVQVPLSNDMMCLLGSPSARCIRSLDLVVSVPTAWPLGADMRALVGALGSLGSLEEMTVAVWTGRYMPPSLFTAKSFPVLRSLTVDLKQALVPIVTAAEIFGDLPSLRELRVVSEHLPAGSDYEEDDGDYEEDDANKENLGVYSRAEQYTNLGPHLAGLPLLQDLVLQVGKSDLARVLRLRDPCVELSLRAVTRLELSAWMIPSSYAFLESCPALRELDINLLGGPYRSVDAVATQLTTVRGLRSLTVYNVNIGRNAECLAGLTSLTSLDLGHVGLETLAGMGAMPQLLDCAVADHHLTSLRGLEGSPELRSLSCNADELCDASALRHFTALTSLRLSNCRRLARIPLQEAAGMWASVQELVVCSELFARLPSPTSLRLPSLRKVFLGGDSVRGGGMLLECVAESGAPLESVVWRKLHGLQFAFNYPRAAWFLVYRDAADEPNMSANA